MKKSSVIINYKKFRQSEIGPIAQGVHDSLTGNSDFPTPPVTLSAFQTLIDNYLAKLAAAFHGTVAQTAEKNVAKADLLTGMRTNAIYVNTTANGNEVKLAGSGYVFAKTPQPRGPFEVPKKFTVLADRQPGRANIDFGAMNGAAYMVRITNDVNVERNLWPTTIDTRRSFYIEGLKSGERYTAIGAYKGTSNELKFTNPVEVVIQ